MKTTRRRISAPLLIFSTILAAYVTTCFVLALNKSNGTTTTTTTVTNTNTNSALSSWAEPILVPRRALLSMIQHKEQEDTDDTTTTFAYQYLLKDYRSLQQVTTERNDERRKEAAAPFNIILDRASFSTKKQTLVHNFEASSFNILERPERSDSQTEHDKDKQQQPKDDNAQWCGQYITQAAQHQLNGNGAGDKEGYSYSALSPNESRILITGMLSHSLGVSVALALKEKCGIVEVAGVDNLHPNTAKHRMQVLEDRYKLLVIKANVTLLNHDNDNSPLPFVGVQPRARYYEHDSHSWEAEHERTRDCSDDDLVVDAIVDYRPTHIIHLASLIGAEEILHQGTFASAKHDSVAQQHSAEEEWREYVREQEFESTDADVPKLKLSATVPPQLFPSQAFRYQQCLSSMEQVLRSMRAIQIEHDVAPHLVYASSHHLSQGATTTTTQSSNSTTNFVLSPYAACKAMEESLVHSFASRYNFSHVGLRFSTFYGPAGSFGTDIHDMAERATLGPNMPILLPEGATILEGGSSKATASSTKNENRAWWDWVHTQTTNTDLMYVDDATEAILAAAQYNPHNNNSPQAAPHVFHIGSNETTTLTEVASLMEHELSRKRDASLLAHLASNHGHGDGETFSISRNAVDTRIEAQLRVTRHFLGWTRGTSIENGVSKTLHYHFYKRYPYGPSMQQISESANKESSTLPLEWVVPPLTTIPCSSECSYEGLCLEDEDHKGQRQTVWSHRILEASVRATTGCAVALYSENFDLDILEQDAMRTSSKSKNADLELLVCKVFFVRKKSDLVSMLISSLVSEKEKEGDNDSDTDSLLEEYNGNLQYKHWNIVWLDSKPRKSADVLYAKMTPLHLFAESVIHAMYLDPYRRSPPPGTDEIMSIAKSMLAKQIKAKKKWIGTAPKRYQITIPKRPSRRAAIMASYPEISKDFIKKLRQHVGDEREVMKYFSQIMMRFDLHKELPDMYSSSQNDGQVVDRDVAARRKQMAYYDFVHKRLNKDLEFRDLTQYLDLSDHKEAQQLLQRIEMYPIFSQWVIHDLQLEAARELRCDWFAEQMVWDTSLQDSSLSYILAKRSALNDLGTPCGSWIPVLKRRSDNRLPRHNYPYEVSGYNRGCRMYSDSTMVKDSRKYGVYVALTKKPLSEEMGEKVLKAAKLIAEKRSIRMQEETSEDKSEDLSKTDAMDLMATLKEHTALNKGPPQEATNEMVDGEQDKR
jgi:nucleoside-diphosphate-sugar epimerase